MKGIKKERALAPDEVRDLRAANYEFTVDEYEKLCNCNRHLSVEAGDEGRL